MPPLQPPVKGCWRSPEPEGEEPKLGEGVMALCDMTEGLIFPETDSGGGGGVSTVNSLLQASMFLDENVKTLKIEWPNFSSRSFGEMGISPGKKAVHFVLVFFFSPADPNVQVFTPNSSQSNPSEKPQQQKGLNPTSVQEYVCVLLCACTCVSLIPVSLPRHVSRANNYQRATKKRVIHGCGNLTPPPTSHLLSLHICSSVHWCLDATSTCGCGGVGGIMGESPPLHPHISHANGGGKKIPIHKHKLSAHIHNFQSVRPSRASTCWSVSKWALQGLATRMQWPQPPSNSYF